MLSGFRDSFVIFLTISRLASNEFYYQPLAFRLNIAKLRVGRRKIKQTIVRF